MSLRVTSSIFVRARVVPRRLTRPTISLARVGLHTGTPNHHHWKSANLKRGGGGLFRRASSIAFANPPGGAPDKQIAPSWKEEVLSSHATLGKLCFVLCAPQGPQNCGAVARVMQNFGIYDLRLVNPGPFVLLGDESDDDDTNAMYTQTVGASTEHRPDGANSVGGVNSGAKLGPDGLGFGNDLPQALRATLVDVSNASVSKGDASLTSSDDETKPKPQPQPLCAEAFRFACAADWLLRVRVGPFPNHARLFACTTLTLFVRKTEKGREPSRYALRRAFRLYLRHGHHRQAKGKRPVSHRASRGADVDQGIETGKSRGAFRERTHGADE